MITVLSFSLFTYFIGKLKLMIEANNKSQNDQSSKRSSRGFSKFHYLDHQLRTSLIQKQSPGHDSELKTKVIFLKLVFIFFNLAGLISFLIIVLSFFPEINSLVWEFVSSQESDELSFDRTLVEYWNNPIVKKFYQGIKTLTGIIFFFLGIAILSYGTNLETAVSQAEENAKAERK